MDTDVTSLLDERRSALERAIGRPFGPVVPPADEPLPERDRTHLREEAEELYWNELEWENITSEEAMDGGAVTELTFPGFLAFVQGLLLREALPDAKGRAAPRPEVVQDVLAFLSRRVLDLGSDLGDGEDPDRTRAEHALTAGLLDLVLMRLHGIDPADV